MAQTNDDLQKAMDDALESVERIEKERRASQAAQNDAMPQAPDGLEIDPLADADKTNQLKEQLLRLAADFENYRKRAEREIRDAKKFGIEAFVRDLLPVADNLERALAHSQSSQDPIVVGVKMVMKQLTDVLASYGITPVEAVGVAFDPEFHEAVSQVPAAGDQVGMVVEQLQKGYMLHNLLLRPAQVVVSTEESTKPTG